MIKFEFVKENDSKYKNYRVKVNGIEDKHSFKSEYGGEVCIRLYSQEVCNLIRNERIIDLLKEVDEIDMPLEREYVPDTIRVNDSAEISVKKHNEEYSIGVEFQYNYELWARGYTIPDIVYKLEEVNKKNNNHISFSLSDSETTLNGFIFCKIIKDKNNILKHEIISYIDEIKSVFEEAAEFFTYKNKDSIYFEFDIEKSIQVASKQYLMYFTQFLEDIGIEAESEIKSKTEKVLFEVIPKDKTVALKNIRDCLEIYLNLINDKNIEAYDDYRNVAVMQLKANINHLKGQLILANTIIEQKQITIDLLKSAKVIIPEEEKSEIKLLNGTVKIKEFEWNGLTISPVKLFNLLKRRK